MMAATVIGKRLVGVIPPMVTPFDRDGDLDVDMHLRNIARWEKDELCGYLVLGSNSESAYLSYDEKLKLIEATVQAAWNDRIVLAGTGGESTRETLRFTYRSTLGG